MMPNLDRAEIARLLAAATPGPWSHSTVGLTNEGQRPISTEYGRVALADCQTEAPKKSLWQTDCATREANAALIALAPALACVYVDGALGAEAMKQACYYAVPHDGHGENILAIPSPSPADLLTAALALPEVQAEIAKAVTTERARCAAIARPNHNGDPHCPCEACNQQRWVADVIEIGPLAAMKGGAA